MTVSMTSYGNLLGGAEIEKSLQSGTPQGSAPLSGDFGSNGERVSKIATSSSHSTDLEDKTAHSPVSSQKMLSTTAMESNSNLDTTKQMKEQKSNPRLFALLIGINTYNKRSQVFTSDRGSHALSLNPPNQPAFTNLRGAVADADQFYKYLTSDLGVPEKQITDLSDDKATRVEIIKAFQRLGDEKNEIRKGDSIVIFYAGHGAQARPPRRLLNAAGCPEHIELLVPHDYNEIPGRHEYMGIPDYTLAALLNTIAKNKGNNITVIFDCCHSASSLRGCTIPRLTPANNDSQPITRSGPELDYHIPDDLDEDIWGGRRAMTVPPPLRHLGVASYVFFSACASFELAREKDGRGCFTSSLLKLLQEMGSHALPCSQIISRLQKIDGQSPQCEGRHIDRSIFHGFSSSNTKRFFNVRALAPPTSKSGNPSKQPTQFILDAGSVNGLSQGDEFTVYKTQSDEDQNDPKGHFVIDKILPDRSKLRVRDGDPPFYLPSNPAPALLTAPAQPHLQLYIDVPDDETHAYLVSRINQLNLHSSVFITPDRQKAHISLSTDDAKLRFDVVDSDIALFRENLDCSHYLDEDIEQEKFARTLKDLSHYYWHLKRDSSSLPVTVAFYELEQHPTPPYFRPINEAAQPPLYNSKTKVIDLTVDAQLDVEDASGFGDDAFDQSSPSIYGLEITNTTQRDLFPALFYFDNTKFTISSSYQPPLSGQKAEPPLKIGNSMTIGYGMGAGETVPPFTFYLTEGRVMEIGFFKLILSTEPIDLRGMVQEVPIFDTTRAMEQKVRTPALPAQWASYTIKVVQRLREASVPPMQ